MMRIFLVTAQPLCIFEEVEQLVGQQGTLVGWGKLAGQSAPGSIQQSLSLPLLSMEKCRTVYSGTIPLNSDAEQICAGGIEGYDACAGFGGAPLIRRHHVAGVFYQVRTVDETLTHSLNACVLGWIIIVWS